MKYYIALAINKNNPEDIFGLCENSFSMSWERNCAKLFEPSIIDPVFYNVPLRIYVKVSNKNKSENTFRWCGREISNKGQKRKLRKVFTNKHNQLYHICGRTPEEYAWNWCNHYALFCSNFLKYRKNYEIKCFRVNSKYCPVHVDLSVREGMERKKITFNKYEWRNANFVLKLKKQEKNDD